MKISCQNCSSKYTVSDEKVQGKTVKLKCKKCGATILVNSGGATTVQGGAGVADHASSPSDAASADGTSYMVNVAEGDQRTMTLPELVGAYQSQVVTADTYVWADGMSDWQPLGQVEAIVSALSATPAAPAVAPSAPPPAMAPSGAEAVASAASLAASARPAARRENTGRRADVFGNEKQDDVATSAPLFSASARAAASNAAAAAKPAQREENSVLFSLSALTQKAATATPPPGAPSRKDSREDSGLIDLRALAAAAAPAAPAAAAASAMPMGGHDDGGLFPLGIGGANQPAAPPVATPVLAPPPASKAPMFIGVGALVAALAIVGVFFAMKGGEEKPGPDTAQTTVAAQPTPTQTAAPAPTPTATAEATPDPSASAAASGTAVAGTGSKKGTGGTSTAKGSSTAGTAGTGKTGGTTTAPASTGASKPKGNCGCSAGDLMCAMKCSAGGK